MALDPTSMINGFTSMFQNGALGIQPGAAKMASIYASYAATGMFGASAPVFTGLEQELLATTLAAVFGLQVPNPTAFGTAWQTGLLAFWLTPPIVVTGVQSGLVTSIVGTTALPAALAALFAVPSNPAPVAASLLATALHVCTLTTIATVAPPPSTLVSIL